MPVSWQKRACLRARPDKFNPMEQELNSATVFFSGVGSAHASHYNHNPCFRDRLNLFLQAVQRTTPEHGKILDFGCGPGNISLGLSKLGYNVLGLDGASGMIEIARSRALETKAAGLQFEQMDATQFDHRMGPFEAVVCSSVIEYVNDDSGLLKKLIASLRPGGHLLVSVPHGANVFAPIEPLAHRIALYLRRAKTGHLAVTCRRYSRKQFLRKLGELGLEDLHCTSFECPVFGSLGIKLSRWTFLGRMLLVQGRKSPASPAAA